MKKNIIILLSACFLSITIDTQAQVDRSKMPEVGATPSINLASPKTFELKNGLKVMVVENHKLPRVSASLTIDNAPIAFGEKTGVADLAGALLGSGTSNISKDDFNKKIDYLGARMSFWETGASMNALSKYSNDLLDLMADGIKNPVFSQEEFDKQKAQVLEGLKSETKSVKAVAGKVQNALTYGKNHPYGEFVSEESINAVTLEDVQAYYNTYYKPNNAYLVIIGDVKYGKIKKKVKALFSDWKSAELPVNVMPKVMNATETEIDFIDMPNAVQSELAITSTIELKRGDKDFFAVLLANKILGGGFNSYLNMNLREAHGWTYGARTSMAADRYIGEFSARTSIRNSVTDSAIVESMIEINRIRDEKVDATALENAKKKYIGDFVLSLEKPSNIARYALRIETNNLPEDYYKTYLQKLNSVTVDDVKRVANKYINNNGLRIIVTGKGSDVAPALEKLGYKVNYFNAKGESIAKPVFEKEIPAGVTVETVVSAYENAIGGAEAISKINSVVSTYEANMQGMVLEMKSTSMAPNYMSQIISMGGSEMSKTVFNGKTGYTKAQGQTIPFTESEIESSLNENQPIDVNNYKKGKLVKITPIDGKDAYVVKSEGKTTFFDVATGLIVQELNESELPNGEMAEQKIQFGDYKMVDGVKFPHQITIFRGPRGLDFIAQSIKVNSKLKKSIFN
ncbi:MAG: M16 family metallopeptidase [Flavobacteriales bacterium]